MFSRRDALVGAGAFVLSAGLGSPRAAARAAELKPHALADFFSSPRTRGAALSPDGGRIAVLHATGEGDKRKMAFDLLDAADPAKALHRIPLGDEEAFRIEWATGDRLLIWVDYSSRVRRGGVTFKDATIRRLLAVGVDGSNPVVMFDGTHFVKENFNLAQVVDLLPDDPDHILMQALDYRDEAVALCKLNIHTGEPEVVERGRSRTSGWTTEKGVAILRYDWNARGTIQSVFARAPGEREWKLARKTHVEQQPEFTYIAPTDDPMVILAAVEEDGQDTVTVREMDLRTLALGKVVSSRVGRDAIGGLADERRRYLGATYVDDRLVYDFIDPALGKHFAGINAFLGHECNVRLFDVDAAQNRFLAAASGPREPGVLLFYDKAAKRLEELGTRQPNLEHDRLAPTRAVKVATRDGAEITAYLTAPLSGAPGPLVVLPHGGPEVRDHLDWNRQVQILAAQGWWVLQPNFRGSGGYGRAFAKAGWRRWGDRMQEDVEDAVAQVIAVHKLDAKRVAIMGTSYGGYAALMGAVRRPDLYKAAISICGVTDLPEILNYERAEDETPDKEVLRHWIDRIGDPAADEAALVAASPRRRAAEIRCPVLLVHGVYDPIVPVRQSRLMAEALKKADAEVELVEVPDAGHANWEDEEEQKLMARYVALLTKAFA